MVDGQQVCRSLEKVIFSGFNKTRITCTLEINNRDIQVVVYTNKN